ncbi:FkbM family methyltransferase [Tepidamorphus sp. 3E244]|uniref:FkbM family methyltransferase n=1 Tax=Tepidamorphus sp. 3E244 TaxID=3385498 RepID=UPI0038FC7C57
MKIRSLKALEDRFRHHRDRLLGRSLFNSGLSAKAFYRSMGVRGDIVIRRFSDHSMALDPADHVIGWRILNDGAWQRDELLNAIGYARRKGALNPGGCFLDVGANIGSQTVYALLTGEFSNALAIEPVPGNVELLSLNIHLNKMSGRAIAVESAAGSETGTLTLSVSGHNSGGHSSRITHTDATPVEVPVARLDDILQASNIAAGDVSFVWIDAEGAEPDILFGMDDILATAPPMVIEWNAGLYSPSEIQAVTTKLAEHYVTCVDIDRLDEDGEDPSIPIEGLAMMPNHADVLCLPERSSQD